MNLLNYSKVNWNYFHYALIIILSLLWTFLLVNEEFLIGGIAVILFPVFLLILRFWSFRVFVLINAFFIQNISYQKGLIAIFPIDVLYLVFLIAFSFSLMKQNCKSDSKSDDDNRSIFLLYLVFFFSCLITFFTNLHNYELPQLVSTIWYLLRIIQLVLTIYVITKLQINYKQIEAIFDIIILCSLLQLPVSFYQLLNGAEMTGLLSNHHGYLGTLLLIPFFLSVYKLFLTIKLKKTSLLIGYYLLSTTIILYMIYGSGCRSSLLGLIVCGAIFVFSILTSKNAKAVIATLVIFCILIFISLKFTPLMDVINKTFNNEETGSVDISTISRLLIWKYTFQNFLSFDVITKIMGIGVGTFGFLDQKFILWDGSKYFTGAHMNPLHILVETGILGLLIFSFIFYFKFKILLRKRTLSLAKCCIYMNISLLISGISQETFWFQPVFGTLWLFYIVVIVLITKQINNESYINYIAGKHE